MGILTFSANEIKGFFKKRDAESHKGTFGTVLVIGGSYEMPNAVCFASQGAVNSGAGLVKVAGIVREAGFRTKIAVYSEDPNVDAVGSCIGNRP